MRLRAVSLLLTLALFAAPAGARADGLSLRVDFDGTGHGQIFHGTVPPTPPHSNPTTSTSTSTTTTTTTNVASAPVQRERRETRSYVYTGPSPAQIAAFEEARLREQQAEAAAREERARLDRVDRSNRLAELYRIWQNNEALDDDAEEHDARVRIKLRDAMPEFIAQQARDRELYNAQLRRISAATWKITVPSPQICESILLLGVGATPDVAEREQRGGDPITGKPYDCGAYGFASTGQWSDLVLRGLPDHLLQSIDWVSPITKYNLRRLGSRVRSVPVVVAHSNGAAIAEVLIRTHRLVDVKELHILGGDGALMHLDVLQKLADDYHIKVSVFAIKGDPVTLTPLGWQQRAYGESLLAQVAAYATQPNLSYAVLGLSRRPADNTSNLQVTLLDYPKRTNPIDYHVYDAYAGLLKGLRMMGCMAAKTDSRCNVSY